MIDTDKGIRCENENESGVRCVFGPGHSCKCSFKPLKLTDPQIEMLQNAAKVQGTRRLPVVTTSEAATIKALIARGLIKGRWVASRAWDIVLTKAGRRYLEDLPR